MPPGAPTPDVSVVVITMNRRGEVLRCLDSLAPHLDAGIEVLVIDNGSSDGTAAAVRGAHPGARIIEARENLGVAGGRNVGLAEARAETVVFLDDDACLVGSDALRRAAAELAANPRLAALAFTVVTDATGALERDAIPRRDKRGACGTEPSAYFCGCGFALRRAAALSAGGFWAPLVYAAEEPDLSFRLLARGHEIAYTSDLVVRHRKVPAARPSGQYVYFNARNRPWVAARSLPWRFVATTTLLWWARLAWIAVRTRQMRRLAAGVAASLAGFPAVLRQREVVPAGVLRLVHERSGRLWY